MDKDPILGEIDVSGRVYDGRYDKSGNFLSVVGFLYGGEKNKYCDIFLKTAGGEKHLLPNIGEAIKNPDTTFISDYVLVNSKTIGEILRRTEKTYDRLNEKKRPAEHLQKLDIRIRYLSKLEQTGKEIIELIGGGSIVDVEPPKELSDTVIRKIANYLVTPSYRNMKFGTKGLSERTEIASKLNGIPADMVTFRTANPWVKKMIPHLKKSGYNYVPFGESMRADGMGNIIQYMLFQQTKNDFEDLRAYAEARYQTAWNIMKPYSNILTEFMNEGIEKVSIKKLKMTYRETCKTLSNNEDCDFLLDIYEKIIRTLNSFGCHDLEEFEMRNGIAVQITEERGIPAPG